MNKKHIIRITGLVLMLISAVFLIQRVISLNVNLTDLLTPANTVMIAVISLLGAVVVFVNSFCWRLCLRLFSGKQMPVQETFSVYARANIMKYLPGNVGHYAGRQLYGTQLGIKQFELAIATILELAYSSLVMLLCAFSFSAKAVMQALSERVSSKMVTQIGIAVIFAILIVFFILFVFRENKYIQALLKMIKTPRFWRTFLICMFLSSVGALIIASGYLFLLSQYTTLDFHSVMLVFSSNFVATFVGFITPGVPGGIGVRETVLTALLSPYFPESIVILVAFSHRIAMILMDLLAVPISGIFDAKRSKTVLVDENK